LFENNQIYFLLIDDDLHYFLNKIAKHETANQIIKFFAK